MLKFRILELTFDYFLQHDLMDFYIKFNFLKRLYHDIVDYRICSIIVFHESNSWYFWNTKIAVCSCFSKGIENSRKKKPSYGL